MECPPHPPVLAKRSPRERMHSAGDITFDKTHIKYKSNERLFRLKTIVDSGSEDLSKMNFDVSDEQKLVLDEVDRACRELRPLEDQAYLAGKFNDHLIPIFKKSQLLGLPISRRYGEGQGADILTYALALERIGREGTGVRTFLSGHVSLGQLTVQKWGNEDQKQRYLPPATRGEKVMCFGLTEPTAGSDPTSLRTSFEDKGTHYLLNGSKAWISNGSISDISVIFAYPKGKHDGMCAFIVERFRGLLSPATEAQTRNADLRHWIDLPRQLQGPKGESPRFPWKGARHRLFRTDERQTQCRSRMFGSH